MYCILIYTAFVIIWIRYRHIKAHYADSPIRVQLINIASFIFGFLSMMGLMMVASFQVSIQLHMHACRENTCHHSN